MSDLKTKFEMIDRSDNAGISYPGQSEDEAFTIMRTQQVQILRDQCGYRSENLCLMPYRLASKDKGKVRRECLGKRCPLIIKELREEESNV